MSGMIASAVIGGISSNNAANKQAAASQAAIDANAWQGKLATSQYDDYKTTYQPLEKQFVADAANYDSPEARNTAASEAQAGVSSELGKAQARLSRTVGFDPSSASAQAQQANLALSGAAMGATAQNAARKSVKDTAYAHQLDALGLGKGLVANASTGFANAASGANAIAAQQGKLASNQASGAGALTAGIIGGLKQVDWSKFNTNQFGNTPAQSQSLTDWSASQSGYGAPGYDGP